MILLANPATTMMAAWWHETEPCQDRRLDHGLILLVDGVGGGNGAPRLIRHGLRNAGIHHASPVFDWCTAGYPPYTLLNDLMNRRRNLSESHRLAAEIMAYRDGYPIHPLHVIAISGGSAITVAALEMLPADTKITSAILLAPALSSSYDLRPALEHTT